MEEKQNDLHSDPHLIPADEVLAGQINLEELLAELRV